jgi:hypothetical protein
MTRRDPHPPGLLVEQLEDRLTPAGSQVPAGEFNWTQYSPTGELAQLVWDGQTLVYRSRAANAWHAEAVVTAGTYTQPRYDTRDQVQRASQSAQLVFTADGAPHVLFLDPVWVGGSNAYQTVVRHFARYNGAWQLLESVTAPWLSTWGPSNLVAEAGPNNALHLLFAETYNPATGVGAFGTGILWHATNKGGSWAFDRVADTTDLKQDVWFTGARWAPRFLSLAIDGRNNAHVTYTPQFYIAGAFSTVTSELRYATNAGGSWRSERVLAPADGTGDAGLGASVAVAPNGQVAIASYFVDRYPTGSPQASKLVYHTRKAGGGWAHADVVTRPDGYAAGDGARFTGFAPYLYFDSAGRANVVFSDEAGEHLPVTYANEVAGQIRVATLANGRWTTRTVYRQTDPLVNQLYYPVAATRNGQTVFAGLRATATLDGNKNPVRVDYTLVDVGAPNGPAAAPQPAAPAPAPVPAGGAPVRTIPTAPGPTADSGNAGPSYPAGMAVGSGAGVVATVHVYRTDGTPDFTITPFGDDFAGGARVVRADVTGDGTPDVVVGSGGGIAARVRIWDGQTRELIFDVDPFGDFDGGVVLAAADLNGDRVADLAIAPDVGGGPRIQVWAGGSFAPLMPDFYGLPYPEFRGGVRLAAGDVNRDGFADLIVAPGGGGGPRLTVYNGRSIGRGGELAPLVNDFYVFDETLRTGLYLAAGDVDGDGFADVIAGTGAGGGPRVRVVSGAALAAGREQADIADFFAGDPDSRGGVRVGVVDHDRDGRADLIAGSGDGPAVGVYTGADMTSKDSPAAAVSFGAFDFSGGVYVG